MSMKRAGAFQRDYDSYFIVKSYRSGIYSQNYTIWNIMHLSSPYIKMTQFLNLWRIYTQKILISINVFQSRNIKYTYKITHYKDKNYGICINTKFCHFCAQCFLER